MWFAYIFAPYLLYKAVIGQFEYFVMLFTKTTIIDNQRIRLYQVVGKFTCFRWIIHFTILIK